MALIIKNGTVITENGKLNADLKIEGKVITEIGTELEVNSPDEVIEAKGKFVLPGVIDAHTHFYMKTATGRTIDNFETGTLSAAFGGVTSYIDYASPVEGKNLLESLKMRQAEAEGHSYLDFSLHMEVTGWHDFDYAELVALKEYGIASLKIYTTYGEELKDEQIPMLLKKAEEAGMFVTVHAEDDEVVKTMKAKFLEEGKTAPEYHGESRPSEAEVKSIKQMLAMAKSVDAPVYIVHVSTGEGAELIRQARAAGEKVYGETCPHYLLLTDACYKGEEPQKYIMTPPLRKESDQELLWKNLQDGTFQCITTDHCSFHIKDKLNSDSCFKAIPGIGGTETLLPLMYSEGVSKGRINIEDLVKLLSTNPAKMFGLYPQKGVLAVGSDADLVILNPEKEVVLNGRELHSAAEYTVYEGFKVKGYPEVTISKGKVICADNKQIAEKPEGELIRAKDVLFID